MTNGNGTNESRLDRIERILEQTAGIAQRAMQIAESNARSIQAWEALIEQNKAEAEQERSEMKVLIRELIRANNQNTIDHELFRRRFEAIDPLTDGE